MAMRGLGMMGIAAVTILSLATPAEAQRRHGGRHHDHDHVSTGGLILGALLGGALVAVAASEDKHERERVRTESYDAPPPDEAGPPPETPAPDSARFDGMYDEEAAADRCSVQAEIFGSHYAHVAHVTRITETVWDGASWLVKGRLELADSYRDDARRTRDFRCTLRRGTEPDVEFNG